MKKDKTSFLAKTIDERWLNHDKISVLQKENAEMQFRNNRYDDK